MRKRRRAMSKIKKEKNDDRKKDMKDYFSEFFTHN